jgi:hypothetical protein
MVLIIFSLVPGTRPEIIKLSPIMKKYESRIHFYLLIEVPRMPDMPLPLPDDQFGQVIRNPQRC